MFDLLLNTVVVECSAASFFAVRVVNFDDWVTGDIIEGFSSRLEAAEKYKADQTVEVLAYDELDMAIKEQQNEFEAENASYN